MILAPGIDKESVKVLSSEDIKPAFVKKITDWLSLFDLSFDSMVIVARHFKWSEDNLYAWFDTKDSLKFRLGIEPLPETQTDQVMRQSLAKYTKVCNSCYENLDKKFALGCGHTFCGECWHSYLKQKVTQGISNCQAQCMQTGCNLTVTHSAFTKILTGAALQTYWTNLCRQFTSEDRLFKWCSQKGCEYCFQKSLYSVQLTVECKCGHETCLACGFEKHSPCYCNVVALWDKKSNAESENLTWIMANTKPCPKC